MNAAAWQGPPADILGHPAPIQQFVVRTDRVVVALRQAVAFPEGCSLTLHIAVRRGSWEQAAWDRFLASRTGEEPTMTSTEAGLKFGVRFPDGSSATTVDNAFPGWAPVTDRPEPPMLIEVGGESTSTDQLYLHDRQLWLWPLPPPGPFEFVVEWQGLGIGATVVTLDGRAVARAAEQALPYWP